MDSPASLYYGRVGLTYSYGHSGLAGGLPVAGLRYFEKTFF
jgi:hypothetical protein